jgi:sRNA-binding protein
MEMGSLTAEQVDVIVRQAETKATEAEKAAAEQRRQQREQDRLAAAEAAEAAANPSPYYADGKPAEVIEQAVDANTPAAPAGTTEVQETVFAPLTGTESLSPPEAGDADRAVSESAERPVESSDDAPQ